MNKKEILKYKKLLKKSGEWYQPVKFMDGLHTDSKYDINSLIYGKKKWDFIIRKSLPKNLKGKTILELGSSCCLYSVLAARDGAKVVAVELNKQSIAQAKLLIEIFSKIDGVDYSKQITIIEGSFMNLSWKKYDIVLALNVLYWIDLPYVNLNNIESKIHTKQNDLDNLITKIIDNSKLVVIQTDENKYYLRKKNKLSVSFTHSSLIAKELKRRKCTNIKIFKPIVVTGLLRSIVQYISQKKSRVSEIDLKKPWLYSRPIVVATCPSK